VYTKKALRIGRKAIAVLLHEHYLCVGAAGAAAAGAVEVCVEVTADTVVVVVVAGCAAGFAASCFWHPTNTKIAATRRTAMIAVIFFMVFHPLSFLEINSGAFVAIE